MHLQRQNPNIPRTITHQKEPPKNNCEITISPNYFDEGWPTWRNYSGCDRDQEYFLLSDARRAKRTCISIRPRDKSMEDKWDDDATIGSFCVCHNKLRIYRDGRGMCVHYWRHGELLFGCQFDGIASGWFQLLSVVGKCRRGNY